MSSESNHQSLMDVIQQDLTLAMKAREREKMDVLRFMKSLLLQNRTAPKPQDELSVVISYVNKLQESVSTFPSDSPLREKTLQEITMIKHYLPAPLLEAEVVSIINDLIQQGLIQFPAIMKELTGKIKGRFDSKRAVELVKQLISSM